MKYVRGRLRPAGGGAEDGEGGAPPVGLPMPEPEPVCDVTERA